MALGYALDANYYIAASRDATLRDELAAFHQAAGYVLRLCSVVEMELIQGAAIPSQTRVVDALLHTFDHADRILVPPASAYRQAGRVMQQLAQREGYTNTILLANDALIAVTCREADVALITHNARDFHAIKRHLRGFQYLTALPRV